jgi:hypothetical protein
MGIGAGRKEGLAGSPSGSGQVLSIHHDPCYHILLNWSSTIIVLVFSELAFCSKDSAKRRKQRGRAHCVSVQGFKNYGMRSAMVADRAGEVNS